MAWNDEVLAAVETMAGAETAGNWNGRLLAALQGMADGSSRIWMDAPEMEATLAHRPLCSHVWNGHDYLLQSGSNDRPVASGPFGSFILPDVSTASGTRRVWSVSTSVAGVYRLVALCIESSSETHVEVLDDLKGSSWTDATGLQGAGNLTTFGGSMQQPMCMIDMGAGKLILAEYGAYTTVKPTMWKSADAGSSWTKIMELDEGVATTHLFATGGPIRHFHGGLYDSDNDVLYIFTGDYNGECSILVAPEALVEFFGAGTAYSVWKTRWALDVPPAEREAVLASNPEYCVRAVDSTWPLVPYTGQALRTVQLAFEGDWCVYADDRVEGETGSAYSSKTWRFPRVATDRVAEQIGTIVGCARDMLTMTDGTIVIAAESVSYEGDLFEGHDAYVRLYRLEAEAARVTELYKMARSETDYEISLNSGPIVEWMGHVVSAWGGFGLEGQGVGWENAAETGDNTINNSADIRTNARKAVMGRIVNLAAASNRHIHNAGPVNWWRRPSINYLDSARLGGSSVPAVWIVVNSTLALVDNDCPHGVSPKAIEITPTAGTDPALRQIIDAGPSCDALMGQFLTASGWVKLAVGQPTSGGLFQWPQVYLANNGPLYTTMQWYLPEQWWDGDWHWFSMTEWFDFQNAETDTVDFRVRAHVGTMAAWMVPIYLADPQVVIGTQPIIGAASRMH